MVRVYTIVVTLLSPSWPTSVAFMPSPVHFNHAWNQSLRLYLVSQFSAVPRDDTADKTPLYQLLNQSRDFSSHKEKNVKKQFVGTWHFQKDIGTCMAAFQLPIRYYIRDMIDWFSEEQRKSEWIGPDLAFQGTNPKLAVSQYLIRDQILATEAMMPTIMPAGLESC